MLQISGIPAASLQNSSDSNQVRIADNALLQSLNQVAADIYPKLFTWDSGVTYSASDIIEYNGSLYQALRSSKNVVPTTSNAWQLLSAFNGLVVSVATIAALRLINPKISSFPYVQLGGYYSVGDGGGGRVRYWASGAAPGTYVDNGGSVIVPIGGDGSAAWLFVRSRRADLWEWGGKSDGSDNDSVIKNIIAHSAVKVLHIPSATFSTSANAGAGYDISGWVVNGEDGAQIQILGTNTPVVGFRNGGNSGTAWGTGGNFTLRNFAIIGNWNQVGTGPNAPADTQAGFDGIGAAIKAYMGREIYVQDVVIDYMYGVGIALNSCGYTHVTRGRIINSWSRGVWSFGGNNPPTTIGTSTYFSGVEIAANHGDSDVVINNALNAVFTDCTIEGSAQTTINVTISGIYSAAVVFAFCYLETYTSAGISLPSSMTDTVVAFCYLGGTNPFPLMSSGTFSGISIGNAGVPNYFGNNPTRIYEDYLTPTYVSGAALAVDASQARFVQYTPTDSTTFNVSSPTNPTKGQRLTYLIRGGMVSGSASVTWDAVFKMAAWVNPSSGYTISVTFVYNGTNWIQDGAYVTVPN